MKPVVIHQAARPTRRAVGGVLPGIAAMCLGVAACDRRPAPPPARDVRPEQTPALSSVAAAATPKVSIMRPSVANEAVEAPPPVQPLTATVHFAFNEADLTNNARATLDRVAEQIRALGGPVVIRGHTDSRGDDAGNLRISEDRAASVRDYLAGRGVPEDRMTTIALGENRPVAPNALLDGEDNEAGRLKNRRVEIVARPSSPADQPTAAPTASQESIQP